MPLVDIEFSTNGCDLPSDVRDFLREAYLRVGQFVRKSPIRVSGFAPSGFATVYRSLRAIVEAKLAPGNSFCELGSGFGVAASLAAMLKFRAHGIEIEKGLVDASKQLANDFGLPVEFVHGSFVPPGRGAVLSATTFCSFLREFSPLEVCAGGTTNVQMRRFRVPGRRFQSFPLVQTLVLRSCGRFPRNHGLLLWLSRHDVIPCETFGPTWG